MALTTCRVTGGVVLPDGQPARGYLSFELTSMDMDGEDLVEPLPVVAPITAGQVAVNLWPNSRGVRATSYTVYHLEETGGPKTLIAPVVRVPELATITFQNLLALPPLPNTSAVIPLTQAQYESLEEPDPRALYLIIEG